jgi:hypothetical protein
MSLQNFIKNLQEQDDAGTVYSPETSQNVKVIPPDNIDVEVINENNTKVIPPKPEQPRTVSTLKLNLRSAEKPVEEKVQEVVQEEIQKAEIKEEIQEEKVIQTPVEIKENTTDDIFAMSGTDLEFKEKWLAIYEKAKSSKKQNAIADRLRAGRFIATQDSVIILPDYDTTNKTAEELLEETWI